MFCFSEDNCGSNCVVWTTDYLSWEKPGILRFLVFMGLQSIISFAILLLNDYQIFSKIWFFIHYGFRFNNRTYARLQDNNTENTTNHTISSIIQVEDNIRIPDTNEDDDVKEEAGRIQNTPSHVLMQTDVLVLNQVEKIYNGAFHAVDQLSVGVKRSECFGLLGVNGA